jgi:hypothetical protein
LLCVAVPRARGGAWRVAALYFACNHVSPILALAGVGCLGVK